MKRSDIAIIEEIIQYKFNNPALLNQAFTFDTEDLDDPVSNGLLRIIGKRSISSSIVNILMEYYGVQPKNSIVRATKSTTLIYDLVDNLTSNDIYRVSINVLGLTQYIDDVKGAPVDADRKLFHAIIGAVTVDCNWDVKTINKVISFMIDVDYWLDYGFEGIDSHPVVLVFNYAVDGGLELPAYTYSKVKDEFGNEFQKCSLKLSNIKGEFVGQGDTLSEARLMAADKCYKFLQENHLISSIALDAGDFTVDTALDTLDNLTLKGYFTFAEYNTVEKENEYEVTCMIDEVDQKFTATDSNKKKAQAKAAYKMALYVTGRNPLDADN